MNLLHARQYILDRLDRELPADLSYHSPSHTRDVTAASLRIGKSEGIHGSDLVILETAALYHDSGFLFAYQNHEERSCVIAREHLPGFGYSPEAVDFICETIMATKIPQSPKSLLAQVLCDADLDYLGSDQFYPIGNSLFKEFLKYGILVDEKAWNRMQVRFLESHAYFTQTAIRERNGGKQQHLAEVKAIVAGYGD
jgi:uncharacterized protein